MPQHPTRPPWRDVLPAGMTELKLCLEYPTLPVTPFHYFVTPEPLAPSGASLFHRFMDLPVEIHLLIFRFCDPPTLFCLLHASSYTRRACSKIFWGPEQGTWYRTDHLRRLQYHGFQPVEHCPEFASRIKQLEIDFDFRSLSNPMSFSFWDKVQGLFPSARKVVLYGLAYGALPPPFGESSRYFSSIAKLVAMAPPNIKPFIAFEVDGHGFESALCFNLWRIEAENCWCVVEDPWKPMRVLLPRRKIPAGLLSDLLTVKSFQWSRMSEQIGLDWLKHETHECYRDTPEIECPDPACDSKFSSKREMKFHFREHESVMTMERESQLTYHPNTPLELKAVLDRKQCRHDEVGSAYKTLLEELRGKYGERDSPESRKFEDALAAEMKEQGYLAPGQEMLYSTLWQGSYSLFYDDSNDWRKYVPEEIEGKDTAL